MKFIKQTVDDTPLKDNVFAIAKLAKAAANKDGDENIVNATIGSLYTEAGVIAAFDAVYNTYNKISKEDKAQYSQSITGNQDYKETVYEWIKGDTDLTLPHQVIATPGGSGAIALTMMNFLDSHMKVLLPDLAWSSYNTMAKNNNLEIVNYKMFAGEHFNIDSFILESAEIMKQQGKLMVIINDPSHNPSGYSMSIDEWQRVIAQLNRLSKDGPCILVNDIAYIDYCIDLKHSRDYLNVFNSISDNVAIIVAFSCSKTLTSYGMRLGAALVMAQNESLVNQIKNTFENSARSIWSNVNNGWMDNFVEVINNDRTAFLAEKQHYIDLLNQRSNLFLSEAKKVNLPVFPYKEGFFITVKVDNTDVCKAYHQALIQNNIFAVQLNQGIRLAICSVPLIKIKGLALKMKKIYDELEK